VQGEPAKAEVKIEAPKRVEPVEAKKPEVAKKPVVPPEMEKISTYNGDSTDKYNWSQTVFDVQV
jgi:hypothetical protein